MRAQYFYPTLTQIEQPIKFMGGVIMKSTRKSVAKVRMYFIMGILVLMIFGTVLVAWSWERSGNNFSFTGGRVFIGVSSPTSSHAGDANAFLQVHNPENNPNNYEVARFTAKASGDKSAYITVGDAVLDRKGTQGYLAYSPGDRKWSIGTHFYGPTLTLKSTGDGGYVGIGNTNPSYPLHLANGAYVSSGGVWTNASSRELKENIESLSAARAMSAFNELQPVVFNYRTNKEERHVGFIAEDVPAIVASSDRKGLSPMDVVGLLTKVVQEQQKLIQAQQQTVDSLSQRIEVLEAGNHGISRDRI
jgi:hypothetical protein